MGFIGTKQRTQSHSKIYIFSFSFHFSTVYICPTLQVLFPYIYFNREVIDFGPLFYDPQEHVTASLLLLFQLSDLCRNYLPSSC